MEIIDELERRVEELLRRTKDLEEENRQLKSRLAEADSSREAVVSRIDGLLKRIQDEASAS